MSKDRSSIEKVLKLNRQALLKEIHEKYARYGDRLVQYLCDKAFQPGGLRLALVGVIRPLPLDMERLHEALQRFLNTEGVEAFFARVEQKESQRDASSTQEISPGAGADIGYRPKIISPAEERGALQRAADAGKSLDAAETRPLSSSPAPAPPKPEQVEWDGRERRSGLERRSGKDRRRSVDLVFKNKRYGGDRRSGLERRSGF